MKINKIMNFARQTIYNFHSGLLNIMFPLCLLFSLVSVAIAQEQIVSNKTGQNLLSDQKENSKGKESEVKPVILDKSYLYTLPKSVDDVYQWIAKERIRAAWYNGYSPVKGVSDVFTGKRRWCEQSGWWGGEFSSRPQPDAYLSGCLSVAYRYQGIR